MTSNNGTHVPITHLPSSTVPPRSPSRSLSSASALPHLLAAATSAPDPNTRTTPIDPLDSSFKHVPYASLYIDFSWYDLLFAYRTTLMTVDTPQTRHEWQHKISRLFQNRHNVIKDEDEKEIQSKGNTISPTPVPPPSLINVNRTLPSSYVAPTYLLSEHNILTSLSARTCFDLYLSSRSFPKGSLVLLSAINIPDMSVVIRAHSLVPVPIDIQLDTLQPDIHLLEQSARRTINGRKVVALLVAHIYGRRFDMTDIIRIGSTYGIEVIEDLAESFSGFEYVGHPASDLSLFSFGTIKICTGFGCGVARVRCRRTYDAMMRLQSSWSVQTRSAFFQKCAKNTLTMAALNLPPLTRAICTGARALNFDHRSMVVSLLRGFPDRLMERLRTQPSSALLSLLHRRLSTFDEAAFQLHQDKCDLMVDLLPPTLIPGIDAPIRNHWLFPVLVEHSEEVLRELVAAGIDTFKGATQLALVSRPDELMSTPVSEGDGDSASSPLLPPHPTRAADLMDRVIYLPVDKRLPVEAIVRIAAILNRTIEKVDRKYGHATHTNNNGNTNISSNL